MRDRGATRTKQEKQHRGLNIYKAQMDKATRATINKGYWQVKQLMFVFQNAIKIC